MENISCILPSNEMALQLDFIFTSVYIGKIKGASKGCVTVSIIFFKVFDLGQGIFRLLSHFSENENRFENLHRTL